MKSDKSAVMIRVDLQVKARKLAAMTIGKPDAVTYVEMLIENDWAAAGGKDEPHSLEKMLSWKHAREVAAR